MRHERPDKFQYRIGENLLKAAELKAVELQKIYSPKLAAFLGENSYGKATLERDYKRVIAQQEKFAGHDSEAEAYDKRLADVFEIFLIDAAEQLKWFGENSVFRPTTKYDDYFNGVDMVASFDETIEAKHLALSTDITFGYESSKNKLEGLISAVKRGQTSEIKYFYSEVIGYAGKLEGIPKIILGLDRTNVAEFIRLWTHQPENPELLVYRNIIITQMRDLLIGLTDISEKNNGGDALITRRYTQARDIVNKQWQSLNIDRKSLPTDEISKRISAIR